MFVLPYFATTILIFIHRLTLYKFQIHCIFTGTESTECQLSLSALKNILIRHGRGRRPLVPPDLRITNELLLQIYILKLDNTILK